MAAGRSVNYKSTGRIRGDMGEVKGKKGSRRDLTSRRKSTFTIKSKVLENAITDLLSLSEFHFFSK
jgi:DUF2075 family protein